MIGRCWWPFVIVLTLPAAARAQAPGPAPASDRLPSEAGPTWTATFSLATYVFPDDDDVLQPTVVVERRALHIEARHNYEDTDSTSMFVGWKLDFGGTVRFAVTPMAGFVAGQTDAGIVAAKVDLTWRVLEAYSEGEYVMPGDGQDRFLYTWSELSVWATDWLRAGLVAQRTRTFRRFRAQREVEPGVLIGLSGSVVEGAFYVFNPWSDDTYYVASLGVSF